MFVEILFQKHIKIQIKVLEIVLFKMLVLDYIYMYIYIFLYVYNIYFIYDLNASVMLKICLCISESA